MARYADEHPDMDDFSGAAILDAILDRYPDEV